MQAKDVLYAAVGAPVVAARKVTDQVQVLKEKLEEEKASYQKDLQQAFETWAGEGEKLLSRLKEGKVVEELSTKMDLDQAKEQVGKLRDQLEEMLETWRQSFRPEKVEEKAETTTAEKPAAKTTTAKKPAAKTTTAKKPAAKTTTKASAAKTTKSSTAAKTSTGKPAASKATKAS